MRHLLIGQLLLIACCISYLVFWSLGYKPGTEVNRLDGLTGVFLLITATLGLAGVGVTIAGFNSIPADHKPPISMPLICVIGIGLYFVLMFLTGKLMNRPVTTELILIVGWLVLELCFADAFAGNGTSKARIVGMVVIIIAATVLSLILYVLYYRMDPEKAYYAAMVPLITEAVGMAGCLLFTCLFQ